jgi:3',5'-cyclic-AMP phosphodiesterase
VTADPEASLPELTTVADDEAVVHQGVDVRRYTGLEPGTTQDIEGFRFSTLPALGERLATIATVNDVHFGEEEAGHITGVDTGPAFRSEPGEPPYPEVMNQGAIEEISALDPDLVVVKGDLTSNGTIEEYQSFLDAYGTFGDRLLHVRGNHDSYHGGDYAAWPTQHVVLPGVIVALVDTSVLAQANGRFSQDQADWLDDLASEADRPVLVFGHHQPWSPDSAQRPDNYFGIVPDDSERLVDVVARRPSILGYFCGHTHRNRVRFFSATGPVPFAEVACVKDYPGTWAEYRVFDGGILHIHRRISTPDALTWTEKTRHMFAGAYAGYALGGLRDRAFAMHADARS